MSATGGGDQRHHRKAFEDGYGRREPASAEEGYAEGGFARLEEEQPGISEAMSYEFTNAKFSPDDIVGWLRSDPKTRFDGTSEEYRPDPLTPPDAPAPVPAQRPVPEDLVRMGRRDDGAPPTTEQAKLLLRRIGYAGPVEPVDAAAAQPTEADLARHLGWEEEEVTELRGLKDPESLDAPIASSPADPDATARGELVADPSAPDPQEELETTLDRERLCAGLRRLPARHRRILVARYGLEGAKPQTLAALAEELGVSQENVRQTQLRAEDALRRSSGGSRSPANAARTPRAS